MPALGARELLDLPAELGRLIHEFLFMPSLGGHPERVGLPEPFDRGGEEVRAIAIEQGLLGPPVGSRDAELCLGQIDWQSPLHRLALLPREILEALSWYLGLAACRDRLRRIVMRDELRALYAQGLSAEHLAFVYQLPEQPRMSGLSSVPESAQSVPVLPDWPQHIQAEGWSVLKAVQALLPDPIAARYELKLPPDRPSGVSASGRAAPAGAEPGWGDSRPVAPGAPLFEWVRGRIVAAWRPDFDARLAALAERPGR